MLKPGGNHFVLRKCRAILEQVRMSLEKYGFDVENNRHLLRMLYGEDMDCVAPLGVFDFYLRAARCTLEAKGGEQNADPDKFKRIMLLQLDIEIGRQPQKKG